MSGMSKGKSFRERLKVKAFRDAYAEGAVRAGVPHQIRSMRLQRNWSQEELAKKMKTSQSAIARLENVDNGKFNISTLLQAASAFDVAVLVMLVPFSRLLKERANLSPSAIDAVAFENDRPVTAVSLRALRIPTDNNIVVQNFVSAGPREDFLCDSNSHATTQRVEMPKTIGYTHLAQTNHNQMRMF
ncbi:MAG: multiprotein-bridging factor 1 family protein [Parvularculaceae bacterium]